MLPNPENSVTAIANLLGVSPGTLYNHIPTYANCAPAASARSGRLPEREGIGTSGTLSGRIALNTRSRDQLPDSLTVSPQH
jgi:hypothetical protein